MEIEYGFRCNTGQTTITDYDLGVVAGVVQWKSGRAGTSGWKEGVLTKGSFSPVSQEIDIARGGSYATMSGFKVGTRAILPDGDPVWKRVRDLGLNFIQADCEFWCWRDGTPSIDWTGKVADTQGDPDEFGITAMDAFRSIHKTVGGTKVDAEAFPDAPTESIGKPIPVALGYVRHAKLLNVSSRAEAIECTTLGAVNYQVVAASAYNTTTLEVTLKTGRMAFTENDTDLVGKYLSVFKGADTPQSVRILSNAASTGTGSDTGTTVVTVDDAFDLGGSTNDTNPTTGLLWSSGHGPNIWWFEINSFDATLLVSRLPIRSLEENLEGRPILEYYEAARKKYVDVSDLVGSVGLSDVSSLGYPGVAIVTKRLDVSGEVRLYFKIIPSQIDFISLVNDGTWDTLSGTHSSAKGNLIDAVKATVIEILGNVFHTGTPAPDSELQLTYDLHIPASEIEAEYEAYYVLMDQIVAGDEQHATTNARVRVTLNVFGKDIYGSVTPEVVDDQLVDTGAFASTHTTDKDTLPPSYYGAAGNNANFYTHKDNLNIAAVIDSYKARVAYPVVRVRIDLLTSFSGNATPDFDLTWTIKELGIIGQKTLNVIEDDLFVKAQGETYQSTWGGRKTAGNLPSGVVDILEHVMRERDGAADYIDTTAFDLAHSNSPGNPGRTDWWCGRQVTEEMGTFEIAQELARFGFFGIIPKRNGKRAPIAWMDAGAAVATHNSSVIDEMSVSGRVPTSLADLFNELEVKYAWNPATSKFDKFLKITRIDEDEFPAEADPEWKTYAIGFPDAYYSVAKECWDRCHLSYVRYGLIRPLPTEMSECKWGPDIAGDWDNNFDYSIAYAYIVYLSGWTPFRKDVVTYTLPNTATHASRELLDKITLNDVEATAGVNEDGCIVRKAIVPGDGEDGNDFIEISLMLEPDTEA